MTDIKNSADKDEFVLEHQEAVESQHHLHAPDANVAFQHGQVAPEAIGGLYNEMPKGYYWSKDFLGTLIVSKESRILDNALTDNSRQHVLPRSADISAGSYQLTLSLSSMSPSEDLQI